MTVPVDHESPQEGQAGREPKLVDVRESIRYRRRAQEAEQRTADLEAELEHLRGEREGRLESLEAELQQARTQYEQAEHKLTQLANERQIERELIRLGARDPETALLVVRERLAAAGDQAVDVPQLVAQVLQEKPFLKSDHGEPVPALGRPSGGVRPSANAERGRTQKLASEARDTGRRGDLMRYMRARRSGAV
ncbi:MAG: hypothetical protein JXL80_16495 [Planctomycetes bacterium]|nr:hypothetical protein [Planctomycetota bacterium]